MMTRWMQIGFVIAGALIFGAWQAQGATTIAITFAQSDACSLTPSAQTTAADVQSYISQCLAVSDTLKTALNTATQTAFQQSRLSPEMTLDMLKRLQNSSASQSQKEQILTVIINLLNAKIPIQLLIDDINDGIQFKVPMDAIIANVQDLAETLIDVKELLDSKGITAQKYSQSLIDTATTEMAKALEDYIANSNSPNSDARNAQAIYEFVNGRLNNLVGTTLTQQIVSDIQASISGSELARLALDACVRREKCTA